METAARSRCAPLDRMMGNGKHTTVRTTKHALTQSHKHVHLLTVKPTTPRTHAHKNKPNTPKEKQKQNEAVQTRSHTLAFPVPPVQLTRLKKKHKNKLHKYFLPSLFLPPRLLVSRVVVFFKSVCVLCSAGGLAVVPCPLGFGRTSSLELPPASRPGSMRHPSSKVKRSSSPQSRSSQRPPSLAPLSSSQEVSGAPS